MSKEGTEGKQEHRRDVRLMMEPDMHDQVARAAKAASVSVAAWIKMATHIALLRGLELPGTK